MMGEGLAEDRIPSQEQECMVVAGLNLLRLQVITVLICFSYKFGSVCAYVFQVNAEILCCRDSLCKKYHG